MGPIGPRRTRAGTIAWDEPGMIARPGWEARAPRAGDAEADALPDAAAGLMSWGHHQRGHFYQNHLLDISFPEPARAFLTETLGFETVLRYLVDFL